jgi:hypothetical protein
MECYAVVVLQVVVLIERVFERMMNLSLAIRVMSLGFLGSKDESNLQG